jgi:hypothetical protein
MTASNITADRRLGRFEPSHPWDRWAFPLLVGLVWLGILMGFVPEIAQHFARHEPPYPPILHVHGVVFGGWLWLLTAQVGLVRAGRVDIHRKLGLVGAALAPILVVVGLATAYVMDRLEFGTAKDSTPSLIGQFTDMLGFATLAGAGLLLRGRGAAHKRLLLLATLYIADAGFDRWLGGFVEQIIGAQPYLPYFVAIYGGNDALMLGLGGYDLATRRRLHPAYVVAIVWIATLQLFSVYVRWNPGWPPLAARLLGH